MAGKTKAAPDDTGPAYPHLERFIEQANPDSAATLFAQTKEQLEALSGAKAAGAKKVLTAMSKVEGLLGELYEVRIRLEGEARKSKNTRR